MSDWDTSQPLFLYIVNSPGWLGRLWWSVKRWVRTGRLISYPKGYEYFISRCGTVDVSFKEGK